MEKEIYPGNTPMMPKYGTDTHGSPASEEGIREDEGKQ